MAIRALSTLKNYFKKYAYPTEQQFHDTLDSFFHKDDKIGIGSMDQEVIDTFNNKAEIAALQAEVEARAQADEGLRDDLDETREDMTQFCGLFGSEDELNTVRPNPKKGDLALVWTPNGVSMYRCESDGEYTDTGQYAESPYLKYSNGQRVFDLSNDSVIFYAKDGSVIAEIDADANNPELSIGTGANGKLDEVRINVKELVEMTADDFRIRGNRPPTDPTQSSPEYSLGFLADEITLLRDLNNHVISLADYIGERIDDRVGSYRAVVVTQSTGLTVFEADFRQTELKIILAEPNASTIVSALTILEPDVPAGFALVRHLIIRNEGNYTINFPSVILGKEINIEAGQKLDASYLFYRSGSSVTYDLTFNVV